MRGVTINPMVGISTKPIYDRLRAPFALGGYALVVALLLLAAFLHVESTRAAAIPLHPACRHWDEMAANVVGRLVHEPADASLRQAGDALFMLRRARSNCRSGWLALSCQDYHAIVRLRAETGNEPPMSKSLCALAMIE